MRIQPLFITLALVAPAAAEAAVVTMKLRAVVTSSFVAGVSSGDTLTATVTYDDAAPRSGTADTGYYYSMTGLGASFDYEVGSLSGSIPLSEIILSARIDPDGLSSYGINGEDPDNYYPLVNISEGVPDGSFDYTTLVGALSPTLLHSAFLNIRFGEDGDQQFGATVTPIPAALPLLAVTLAGLGGLAWRRRRA